MTNTAKSKLKMPRTPALCAVADYQQRGWEDFRNNAGFAADYDKWPMQHQINYETGRRLAAIYAHGGIVPKWARNRFCPARKHLPAVSHPAWRAEVQYIRETLAA